MGELLEMGGEASQFIWLISLAMARITPIFQIVPFLAGRHLTTMVRSALAFALAMFLAPWLARGDTGTASQDYAYMLPLLAKEAALGTLFGLFSSLAFYAASGVGFLIDNQRGLSMASATDPLSGEETSLMGVMATQTMTLVFVATGGLALFFQAILTTYAFWPPFSFWPVWEAAPLRGLLLGQFSWYLSTMVTLAAPLLLICFLVDLGMGLMNRFAPQLNVFFLSMPVKSALSMALLVIYWSSMIGLLNRQAMRLPVVWDALRRTMELSWSG